MSNHPIEKLDAYLEGALPANEMRYVKDHVKQCVRCATELRRAERLRHVLYKTLPPLAAMPRRSVVIRAPAAPMRTPRFSWAFAAVTVGVLVVFGLFRFGSSGLVLAPEQVVATVPQTNGLPIRLTNTGKVYVGEKPLSPELAAPVQRMLTPEIWPRQKDQESSHSAAIRLLQPSPINIAATQPPSELAWTGPTGSPYLVELQRREGGGWSPVPGFPKRIAAFSLSVSGLELGEIFRWRVSTGNATSKWATVKLLRHEEKMQLAEARDRFGEDSFVYGSVCAQFGIYSEAKDALMHEAVAHPGEPGIINALVEVRRQISRLQ